jgi:hypothetical protein
MIYAYDLVHKSQTKANDCWYACIQMLKTYKAGTKTKTIGEAALHLHGGILGHTLLADSTRSKSFTKVLDQNNLVCVCKEMYFNIIYPDTVEDALRKYGPIMIGGMYGRLFGFKKMGHFIVLAGIDTDRQLFKIYDPDEKKPDWRSYNRVSKDFWGHLYKNDDESAIAIKRG